MFSTSTSIQLPSPISRVSFQGFEWDVKRDDLIHELISGNKWRKLKYILLDAREKNKNHLVSFGGAYSNHLLALAFAGFHFNFETTGFIRGEEKMDNHYIDTYKKYGMEIIQVNREDYREKEKLYQKYFEKNTNTYFIDEGGMSKNALKGCGEIIEELPEIYDHIFLACGTGTTVAGIAAYIHQNQINTKVHGIIVLKTTKDVFVNTQTIFQDINDLDKIDFQDAYHFGGYAKKNIELENIIKEFHDENKQIQIEPVYTGKTVAAMIDLFKKNKISNNEKILMIHTGGVSF